MEFAILVPVYLLLLFGMLAYAIYFGAAHSIQQLAADAARTSIAGLSASERDSLVTDYINRSAGTYLFVDPDSVSFEVGDVSPGGTEYRVTITYDASGLPIWDLYPPLPLPDESIRYSSVVRRGGI